MLVSFPILSVKNKKKELIGPLRTIEKPVESGAGKPHASTIKTSFATKIARFARSALPPNPIPTDYHWTFFERMLNQGKAAANLVSDAQLTALAPRT